MFYSVELFLGGKLQKGAVQVLESFELGFGAVNSKPGFGASMSRACARQPSMNLAKIAPLKL